MTASPSPTGASVTTGTAVPAEVPTPGDLLAQGRAVLGIELGSTNIKACLIGPDHEVLATGSHAWENAFTDRVWTYALPDVWTGLAAAVAAALADAERRHGVRPTALDAVGVSAMMHGYVALDAAGELLTPFRTWRNTTTGAAATELTQALGYNIPMRWTAAHLYQAVLDGEDHLDRVAHVTTLAGYVHQRLTGRRVVGVGDASGIFPVDPATHDYDAALLAILDERIAERRAGRSGLPAARDLFPSSLGAGADAGSLTPEGAALLDPTGTLTAGAPVCPPEGDAGTGMVATNAIAPRTGNVSVGTSIFAMIVLEQPLTTVHHEIDLVTTPVGDLVAMVHCNNGASELGEWANVFHTFAGAIGHGADRDDVFAALLAQALEGDADGGGLLAYNYLAGEPVTGLSEGRPLIVRTPDSRLTLGNLMRAQVYGAFGTLSLGMRILTREGVEVDALLAHGGLFRTAGVAQRLLAAAVGTPVAVGETASEGGAWGIAVLAAHRRAIAAGEDVTLAEYLNRRVFADAAQVVVEPDPVDVAGYATFLERYEAGLAIERAAIAAV
ncbi:xylulokinase [Serinibacter arcticus]|uniref:Ribulokinase n=1 Tax=Serinibacter arcticus TaxID=1655435 RepID=A0A4Z1E498_9MICO|nr:FGGY-family carbohydrate kinase [Serinibacter arcticus]TGO05738.1 Ribulokinase [Serinibacter arcticus]